MFNVGKKYAAGSTIYVVFNDHYGGQGRGGVKLRCRRWVTRDLSVDLSGGYLILSGYCGETGGFTGHIDLNFKDYVAPYLGLDVIQGGSESGAHWQFGIRLGSYPGLSGIAVGAVIGALAGLSRMSS